MAMEKMLGREGDLAILRRAFDEDEAQLVTVVGPGGIGKTTLAQAYAQEHVMERPGVLAVLVDLAGTRSVAELFDRVLRALGVRLPNEDGGGIDASVRVAEALSSMGEALLVLDELDELVPFAVDTVGAWLEACPSLSVLVTSRQRLNIAREHVHEVGSVSEEASRQILLRAAQRVRMDVSVLPRDEEVVREIVLMLEGVPLALELAGARLPIIGPSVLRDDLKRASALELQRATRDAGLGAARHVSVAAAVRGSWDALGADDRSVLAQLTVFRGGFTMATAQAVVVQQEDPSASMESLMARSLIRSTEIAGRFDLYAQIREFVVREARVEVIDGAAERHGVYFSTEAERETREWLIEERENVIEVARRVLRSKSPMHARVAEAALRAVAAAKDILLSGIGGPTIEIAELVAPLVERTRDSGADPKLSARVLVLRGALRRGRGEVPSALKDVLSAESIARAVREDRLLADVALEIGKTLRIAGEVDAAHHSFDRAQRLFAQDGLRGRIGEGEATAYLASIEASERVGGDRGKALALAQRAVAVAGNDLLVGARCHWLVARIRAEARDEDARRSAEEALRRSTSSPEDEVRASILVALIAHDEGDLDTARLTLSRALHDPLARGHLGVVSKEQGRAAEAYALLSEASARAAEMRWRAHASYFDSHLAMLERSAGRPEAADEIQKRVKKNARDADVWWPSMGALGERLANRTTATNPRSLPHDEALVVGEGAQWFRPPGGKRVGLERRKSLALMLNCLTNANPGETFRSDALFKAGWPGQKAQSQAAAHSVRVAIATLRKMGLRDLIITTEDGGYGLSTSAPIVRL
jgi:predicted ATPase/tetratricopeptide (TPR) repeat protein